MSTYTLTIDISKIDGIILTNILIDISGKSQIELETYRKGQLLDMLINYLTIK